MLVLCGPVITREACCLLVRKSNFLLVTDYHELWENCYVLQKCYSSTVLTKAKLGEVYLDEYQADYGSLGNLGGSQSAQCWAGWHSGLNILGDIVVLTKSYSS